MTARASPPPITVPRLARACGVDPKTVKGWIRRGALVVESTAGGHARIQRNEALRFLRHHGFPVPGWLARATPRVRVALPPGPRRDELVELLGRAVPTLEVEVAGDELAALAACARAVPDAFVVTARAAASFRRALATEPLARHALVFGADASGDEPAEVLATAVAAGLSADDPGAAQRPSR